MSQFITEHTGSVLRIKGPVNWDGSAAKEFSVLSKTWIAAEAVYFVIDFSGVSRLHQDFYKAVIQLKTALKRDNKTLYSLNLPATLLGQIQRNGVEDAFNSVTSLPAGPTKAKAASSQVNVEFINPFLLAAQKTLDVQCQTKVTPLKPYLKKEQIAGIAIAGVLTLVSNGFSGSVVLCFSEAVFLKIYENMFGEKHTHITPEVEDAAGELLNIIYGVAKIDLNAKGYNFQRALPTVLVGDKIRIRYSGSKPSVIVPFETEAGQFHIEIEFDN